MSTLVTQTTFYSIYIYIYIYTYIYIYIYIYIYQKLFDTSVIQQFILPSDRSTIVRPIRPWVGLQVHKAQLSLG